MNMSCKCAVSTDEYHGWECSITGGPCMYLVPNSKRCAEEYGEGPDVAEEVVKSQDSSKDKDFNCYDCIWGTDKCKNEGSDQYNRFLKDIENCNIVGEVDNSIGCSFNALTDESI